MQPSLKSGVAAPLKLEQRPSLFLTLIKESCFAQWFYPILPLMKQVCCHLSNTSSSSVSPFAYNPPSFSSKLNKIKWQIRDASNTVAHNPQSSNWKTKTIKSAAAITPVGRQNQPFKVWFCYLKKGPGGVGGIKATRCWWRGWGVEHPVVSQPGAWMESLPLWLLLYFLFPCCLALAFTPTSMCVCCVDTCVRGERPLSEQQEYIITQTKGAGLLFMNYQPSKANKGPYFHRKLHFHFSSIWLPEQRK